VRVLFLILFLSWQVEAALQYLAKTIVPETAFETVGNNFTDDYHTSGAPYDDSVDRDVPIGFNFPFNGTTYASVNIDSNGILYFGNYNLTEYSNRQLPRSNRVQSIYPYWDDLNMGNYNGQYGYVKYGTLGNAPNRHLVISWEGVHHYPASGTYTLQVVLYENGAIRFRYDSGSNATGSSATIGVQEDTNHYDQHSYNATIDQTKDVLYIPLSPNMHIIKTSIVVSDPVNNSSNPKRIPGAVIRYCFTVDNDGRSVADNVTIHDSLTGDGKDSLSYVKSGYTIQDNAAACDCPAISDASGTVSGTDVNITFGTIQNQSAGGISDRGCAYIEMTIQ